MSGVLKLLKIRCAQNAKMRKFGGSKYTPGTRSRFAILCATVQMGSSFLAKDVGQTHPVLFVLSIMECFLAPFKRAIFFLVRQIHGSQCKRKVAATFIAVFKLATVLTGHPHRFCDTFAVEFAVWRTAR